MNSFNPAEAYGPPHMMSFVGLESSSGSNSSGQRQQLWDWETTTQQAPSTPALHQASLFANAVNHNSSFYGCPATVLPPMGAATGGGGGGGGYPFHSAVGGGYPAGLIKSDEDGGGAGQSIGLNLGHRTYFPSGDAVAVDQLFRRTRGIYQVSQQVTRCQAEGCKADLSGAKHYHRRHKVCELHSKAAMVVAGGMQQRFCQQCSRFHPLSEFDEAKRSCRRRLAEHNRRRRKSQAPPTSSTAASDRSTPPDTSTTTSTDKSKQSSPKSMSNLAAKDIITTTVTSASTSSTTSRANMNLEETKVYQKTATHLRNGPALSLGSAGGADKGGFGFQYHPQQMPWAVMSDENNGSQERQQPQQRISTSSSSSGIFFQSQNFFCSSANEATQSTTGNHLNNPLQLGQGMLEVDFI